MQSANLISCGYFLCTSEIQNEINSIYHQVNLMLFNRNSIFFQLEILFIDVKVKLGINNEMVSLLL